MCPILSQPTGQRVDAGVRRLPGPQKRLAGLAESLSGN